MKSEYSDDLRELHRSISKFYHSEDELFAEYLKIGCNLFEMETGIVSNIIGDDYKVLATATPLEGLVSGLVFKLQDTYCRDVFAAHKTVAYPHVGGIKRMCDHPVYTSMKLESYISAPLFVNGKIFGTINFTDRRIREGFSEREIELIEIMSNTIGRFLESKFLKQDLKSTADNLNRLIGSVAHDLKTPLGQVLSLAELLKEDHEELDQEERNYYLNSIIKVSSYALEMATNILETSAARSGKIELNKSRTDLTDIAKEAWLIVENQAKDKKVSNDFTTENTVCNVDSRRMTQVLCNLYSNAIKFSPQGSQISTKIFTDTNGVPICEVVDQGTGMTDEQQSQVFEAGVATTTAGTEGEQGTGYGLPLVAKLMELHGGKVEVDSAPQQGSTFRLVFPIPKSLKSSA